MSKDKIEDAIYTRRYIYNFHYHLIWVTKYRNPTFTSEALVNEMKEILTTVAADNEIVIEHMEVMPDHVHVLISFPPSKAPTSAIKALKGRSAFIFLVIKANSSEVWTNKSQFINKFMEEGC